MAGSILRRISIYSLAKVAGMAAGMVSYPILTRVLSPSEYGVMGMVVTILNLTIGFSKMGSGRSVIRLLPEWKSKGTGKAAFILTSFINICLCSLPLILLIDGVVLAISHWVGGRLVFFILLSSPLILIRALSDYSLAVLIAQERSRARSFFEVAVGYSSMIFAVLGATLIIGGLKGYYLGLILGESLILLPLLSYIFRDSGLSRDNFSRPLLRELITFGFPIVIFEISSVLCYTGDRFIIMWLLDEASLGYYTVAYNLAKYVDMTLMIPVMMAVEPAVTNLFEEEGAEAVSAFLSKAARFFILIALPAMIGMLVICEDLLVVLASDKYRPAAMLLPTLLAGFLVAGLREIVGMGILLKKRPWLMAGINFGGAVFNAGLNLLLMPFFQIQGAALATLITQLILAVFFWRLGHRNIPVPLDLGAFVRHLGCALAMGGSIYLLSFDPRIARLVVHIIVGMVVYGGLIYLVDRELRQQANRIVLRLIKG